MRSLLVIVVGKKNNFSFSFKDYVAVWKLDDDYHLHEDCQV